MEYLVRNPLNYFFALLALFIGLVWFAKFKWYWHLPLLFLLALMFFLLTPTGANLAMALATPDRQQNDCEAPLALVVSSDLVRPAKSAHDYGAMSQKSLNQTHSGVEWLNADERRRLVLSGKHQDNRKPGSAKIAYSYLLLLGIDPDRLVYHASSASYPEIAADLAVQMSDRELSMVSSELSFTRGAGAFEARGFVVCPLISPSVPISGHPLLMVLPSAESVTAVQAVLWEIVGLVWYWWTDRI